VQAETTARKGKVGWEEMKKQVSRKGKHINQPWRLATEVDVEGKKHRRRGSGGGKW
jgi:hypothetical protein